MKRKSTRQINHAIKQLFNESKAGGFETLYFDFNTETWKEDDKKWFGANPHRSFRIRRLHKNEITKEFNSGETHVIVRQITPGVRDKVFLKDMKGGASHDALPDLDSVGMVLWKKIHGGADFISLNDVVSEARMMEAYKGSVQ